MGTRDVVVVVRKDDHSPGLESRLLGVAEDLFAAMVGDGGQDHSGVIREIARRGPPPLVVA